ncbi:MAG: PHP domain-containing protein [Gemmatimonadota bacterium]|nr:PHP domain-containing protein [Gemmatimonadota bacterium]MDE2873045.1 PHP domain-containing protein [Gemmatimonadota bacterium]
MKLDLHVHSTASDGTVSPEEVADRAIAGGLDVLALADHDTVAGVERAVAAARGRMLHIIPAIEMSSTFEDTDIHILGYFVNVRSVAFVEHTRRNHERRDARMAEMVERLALQGVTVTGRQLDEQRGSAEVAYSRPHLARALVGAGYVASVGQAFARLIGNDCPAYVPTRIATPEEVTRVILAAGGIPVWAHPSAEHFRRLLPRLVDAGLRGLEAYRATRVSVGVGELEDVARREGLVLTGGSDWHGPENGSELGEFYVTGEEVADFLAAGGM